MRRYPAETGIRLAIPKAKPIRLHDAMSIRAALASITHTCTVHVVASADYARKSDNPEGIHRLRVGIRRVRAAFSIFRQIEPSRRRPAIIGKLRGLQQKLGAAREWDVLIEETIGSMPRQLRNGQALRNLLKIAEVKRAQGHQRARVALEDPRCADLLLQLQSWIDNHFGLRPSGSDPETDPLARQVAGFAEVLGIRHAKARRLGKKIRKLENQELP
jgi:CHAD domain-containing protein